MGYIVHIYTSVWGRSFSFLLFEMAKFEQKSIALCEMLTRLKKWEKCILKAVFKYKNFQYFSNL